MLLGVIQSVPEPLSSESCCSSEGPDTHRRLSKQHLEPQFESVKVNGNKLTNNNKSHDKVDGAKQNIERSLPF